MVELTQTQIHTVAIIFAGVFGLIIGSFLNVVIYRIPNEKSIAQGRSKCPSCEKEIAAKDNIPVLSYFLLRGKCRNCRTRISLRYPIVEIATAAIWAITVWRLGVHISTLGYLFFFAGLIALSAIDIDTQLLPKKLVYISGVILIIPLYIQAVKDGETSRIIDGLIVAAIYSGFLLAIWFLTGGRAMGFGDVRLAIFLGIALGFFGFVVPYVSFMITLLIGTIIGVAAAIITGGGRKMKIPFGPFLAAGTIIALWCVPFIQDLVQFNYA